jgi:outer membrane receptor protein involved in Fe transport
MVVRGSRPGSSSVYIDGMKVSDEMSTLPSLGIGSMEIYTGGIPAKYGDVTGGVIMMTTKSYFDLVSERNAQNSRR